MRIEDHPPTPFPEINAILSELLMNVQIILGNSFIGLYLHGSLANGDFNPQTSDIDFLVVTDGSLAFETFSKLKGMHAILFASRIVWSQKLEGAYIPKNDLRRHDPAHAPIPWLGMDGHFAMETLGSDWIIQRWILREKGLVIIGPPLVDLIDPVYPDDLQEAVRASLREWWSPPFPSSQRFENSEYQVYAVLTMCRSLYMLEHGCVASKPEATRWAIHTLGEPWQTFITAASVWRPGMEFKRLNEIVSLIRYTLKKWGISDQEQ